MRFLLLFSILPIIAISQPIQTQRYEYKQNASDEEFTVISLKNEGIGLIRNRDNYKGGKQEREFILLDTGLQVKKDTVIYLEKEYELKGYDYTENRLDVLFYKGDYVNTEFILLSVILKSREVHTYTIKTELDVQPTYFCRVKNKVLIGGYVKNEPSIILYNTTKESVHVLPGFFQHNAELLDVRVNQNNTFNAVFTQQMLQGERQITLRTFDSEGKLLLEDVMHISEFKNLQTCISSTLQNENLVLLGTWNQRSTNSKKIMGFYSTMINPFADQPVSYTALGELNDYLDYQKPKRAQKIKNRTKKAIEQGKIYNYTNYVVPHKIIEHANGFLLLAEVYQPASKNNTASNPSTSRWPYDYRTNPYGNPYPNQQQIPNAEPDEIKVYSASVLSYTINGVIDNDYMITLNNIKTSSFGQVTDAAYYKGKIIMVYKKESKLYYKIIDLSDDGNVQEGSEKIKLNTLNDDLRDEQQTEPSVAHGYDNVFYIWGYQTIRNQSIISNDKKRDVFYINKLVFR